jgi:carbonic anhydrase
MNKGRKLGYAFDKETQDSVSPIEAIHILKEGNLRFVENKRLNRDLHIQKDHTSGGQYPFAALLGCIDSRVPAELVFDLGIGDIFNTRIAGNFINEDILGSLEFACKVAGSKVIVVLGHTHCGAVKGVCDDVELGNLTNMLAKIKPAVNAVTHIEGERNSSNKAFVQAVADKNVLIAIENIKKNSHVLKEMLDNNEIAIVGGMYDIETGEVAFV